VSRVYHGTRTKVLERPVQKEARLSFPKESDNPSITNICKPVGFVTAFSHFHARIRGQELDPDRLGPAVPPKFFLQSLSNFTLLFDRPLVFFLNGLLPISFATHIAACNESHGLPRTGLLIKAQVSPVRNQQVNKCCSNPISNHPLSSASLKIQNPLSTLLSSQS
jgi:hypothetical protein